MPIEIYVFQKEHILVTFHCLHECSKLLSGCLNVDGEIFVEMNLELNGVSDLQQLLLVRQAGDAELEFGKN